MTETVANPTPRTPLRYSYFPGCSADSTGISYTLSMSYVADKIGLELVEIPDWCCCGISAAAVTDPELGIALSARSMALSETANPGLDVIAPCTGCFKSLRTAVSFARKSKGNHARVEELIEMPYAASAEAYSLLEVLSRPEVAALVGERICGSLQGLKVASYYGCAVVRPPAICQFDNPENPQSMDALMELAGAKPVRWAYKTECCGASHQISTPKSARVLIERILANASANGAEAIVTVCPLCTLNLDLREKEINKARQSRGEQPFDIPIYYFTELLGLVMGGSVKELGLDRHFWPALSLPGVTRQSGRELDVPAEDLAPAAKADRAQAGRAKADRAKTSHAGADRTSGVVA